MGGFLTGRERIRRAMSRQMPDRVPTMPQICHPHAAHILYDDYRKGIAEVVEHPQQQHRLILKVAQQYGVDGIRLFPLADPLRVHDDGKQMIAADPKTGERVGRVDVQGGGHVVPDRPPIVIETIDDIGAIPQTTCEELLGKKPFADLAQSVSEAHNHGFFVASTPLGFTVNALSEYRGRQQSLIDLAISPDLAERIMDAALVGAIESGRAVVKCGVDALYVGDPLASASLISPSHFEQFCLPRFRLFCEELHKPDVLIYLHICGNTNPILEMMADTGVDCVEPLDPLGGVDMADAKRRIGRRVALMGGVNTLTILNGSPEDVYREASDCCRAAATDGGYVLAAGDMVPDRSPEENIRALICAANDFVYQTISTV